MKEVSSFDVVSHRGSLKEIVVTAIFKIFIREVHEFAIQTHNLHTIIKIEYFVQVILILQILFYGSLNCKQ